MVNTFYSFRLFIDLIWKRNIFINYCGNLASDIKLGEWRSNISSLPKYNCVNQKTNTTNKISIFHHPQEPNHHNPDQHQHYHIHLYEAACQQQPEVDISCFSYSPLETRERERLHTHCCTLNWLLVTTNVWPQYIKQHNNNSLYRTLIGSGDKVQKENRQRKEFMMHAKIELLFYTNLYIHF